MPHAHSLSFDIAESANASTSGTAWTPLSFSLAHQLGLEHHGHHSHAQQSGSSSGGGTPSSSTPTSSARSSSTSPASSDHHPRQQQQQPKRSRTALTGARPAPAAGSGSGSASTPALSLASPPPPPRRRVRRTHPQPQPQPQPQVARSTAPSAVSAVGRPAPVTDMPARPLLSLELRLPELPSLSSLSPLIPTPTHSHSHATFVASPLAMSSSSSSTVTVPADPLISRQMPSSSARAPDPLPLPHNQSHTGDAGLAMFAERSELDLRLPAFDVHPHHRRSSDEIFDDSDDGFEEREEAHQAPVLSLNISISDESLFAELGSGSDVELQHLQQPQAQRVQFQTQSQQLSQQHHHQQPQPPRLASLPLPRTRPVSLDSPVTVVPVVHVTRARPSSGGVQQTSPQTRRRELVRSGFWSSGVRERRTAAPSPPPPPMPVPPLQELEQEPEPPQQQEQDEQVVPRSRDRVHLIQSGFWSSGVRARRDRERLRAEVPPVPALPQSAPETDPEPEPPTQEPPHPPAGTTGVGTSGTVPSEESRAERRERLLRQRSGFWSSGYRERRALPPQPSLPPMTPTPAPPVLPPPVMPSVSSASSTSAPRLPPVGVGMSRLPPISPVLPPLTSLNLAPTTRPLDLWSPPPTARSSATWDLLASPRLEFDVPVSPVREEYLPPFASTSASAAGRISSSSRQPFLPPITSSSREPIGSVSGSSLDPLFLPPILPHSSSHDRVPSLSSSTRPPFLPPIPSSSREDPTLEPFLPPIVTSSRRELLHEPFLPHIPIASSSRETISDVSEPFVVHSQAASSISNAHEPFVSSRPRDTSAFESAASSSHRQIIADIRGPIVVPSRSREPPPSLPLSLPTSSMSLEPPPMIPPLFIADDLDPPSAPDTPPLPFVAPHLPPLDLGESVQTESDDTTRRRSSLPLELSGLDMDREPWSGLSASLRLPIEPVVSRLSVASLSSLSSDSSGTSTSVHRHRVSLGPPIPSPGPGARHSSGSLFGPHAHGLLARPIGPRPAALVLPRATPSPPAVTTRPPWAPTYNPDTAADDSSDDSSDTDAVRAVATNAARPRRVSPVRVAPTHTPPPQAQAQMQRRLASQSHSHRLPFANTQALRTAFHPVMRSQHSRSASIEAPVAGPGPSTMRTRGLPPTSFHANTQRDVRSRPQAPTPTFTPAPVPPSLPQFNFRPESSNSTHHRHSMNSVQQMYIAPTPARAPVPLQQDVHAPARRRSTALRHLLVDQSSDDSISDSDPFGSTTRLLRESLAAATPVVDPPTATTTERWGEFALGRPAVQFLPRRPRPRRDAPDDVLSSPTTTAATAAGVSGRLWGVPRMNRGDYIDDSVWDDSYENLTRLAAQLGEARPRGVPASIIANLPTGMYEEFREADGDTRCPICLDDYAMTDEVMRLTECPHWMHRKCLEQWLQNARSCPVCRMRVNVVRYSCGSTSATESIAESAGAGPSMNQRRALTSRFMQESENITVRMMRASRQGWPPIVDQ